MQVQVLKGKVFYIYIRAVTIHQTHDSVRITIFSWGVGEKKKEDF